VSTAIPQVAWATSGSSCPSRLRPDRDTVQGDAETQGLRNSADQASSPCFTRLRISSHPGFLPVRSLEHLSDLIRLQPEQSHLAVKREPKSGASSVYHRDDR